MFSYGIPSSKLTNLISYGKSPFWKVNPRTFYGPWLHASLPQHFTVFSAYEMVPNPLEILFKISMFIYLQAASWTFRRFPCKLTSSRTVITSLRPPWRRPPRPPGQDIAETGGQVGQVSPADFGQKIWPKPWDLPRENGLISDDNHGYIYIYIYISFFIKWRYHGDTMGYNMI